MFFCCFVVTLNPHEKVNMGIVFQQIQFNRLDIKNSPPNQFVCPLHIDFLNLISMFPGSIYDFFKQAITKTLFVGGEDKFSKQVYLKQLVVSMLCIHKCVFRSHFSIFS